MVSMAKLAQTALVVVGFVVTTSAAASYPPLLDHTFAKLQDSKPHSLCPYQGKVVLVVNSASFRGFTGRWQPMGSGIFGCGEMLLSAYI